MSFECHVTAELPTDPRILERFEMLAANRGWKTSTIEGDPVLGKGPRFYFTKHSPNFIALHQEMISLCDLLLSAKYPGVKLVRRKIEAIILDEFLR